jgi:ribosomal protein S6--L-glutamate ligase
MKIVILSRNSSLYSTQALLEAGRNRGHEIRVIDHMFCDIVIDKDEQGVYYNYEKLDDIDAIIPRIGTTATSYGSIVIKQFENLGVFTTLHSDALLRARNKIAMMQILTQHNIDVPLTGISNNLMTYSSIIDKIGEPPYILKLNNGTQGIGVIYSETKRNAESIVEAFSRTDEKILIQKFIKESKGADIRVFVIDGKIVGAMKRQAKPGEFRSNIHRGAQAEKISLTSLEEEVALKSAEVLGLKIAGVDMLQAKEGPMILEVNASPGLEGIEAATQIDIASEMISFIESKVNKG